MCDINLAFLRHCLGPVGQRFFECSNISSLDAAVKELDRIWRPRQAAFYAQHNFSIASQEGEECDGSILSKNLQERSQVPEIYAIYGPGLFF